MSIDAEIETEYADLKTLAMTRVLKDLVGTPAKLVLAAYEATKAHEHRDSVGELKANAEVTKELWKDSSEQLKTWGGNLSVATYLTQLAASLARIAFLNLVKYKAILPALHMLDKKSAEDVAGRYAALMVAAQRSYASGTALIRANTPDEQTLLEMLLEGYCPDMESLQRQIRAMSIAAPQADLTTLKSIPGINPAFINAMTRQKELLQRDDVYGAMLVDKTSLSDPNSYIPVFGRTDNQKCPLEDPHLGCWNMTYTSTHVNWKGVAETKTDTTLGEFSKWVPFDGTYNLTGFGIETAINGVDCRLIKKTATTFSKTCEDGEYRDTVTVSFVGDTIQGKISVKQGKLYSDETTFTGTKTSPPCSGMQ